MAPVVADAQGFMNLASHRNMCANTLVRHFLPAYPMLTLVYSGQAAKDVVAEVVLNYIRKLYPNKPMKVLDVTRALSKLSISDMEGPLEVGFLTYDANRRPALVHSKNMAALGNKYHIIDDQSYVIISGG